MLDRCAAVLAALFHFLTASHGAAQDVTLTSPDGAVEISGTLLGFDGEFYRIDTRFGELTVDGSGVRCDGPACPNLKDFVAEVYFSGASAMSEVLLPALIEGFAVRNGYLATREDQDATHFTYALAETATGRLLARFFVRVGTTDEGFADLLANEADVALSLREIRPAESERAREAGLGDLTDARRSRVVALDAIVPIVAPGNPVTEISPTDLARAFAGEITNWKVLGGPDAPIFLHLPVAGSGLAQAVEDRLMAPVDRGFAPDITRHRRSSHLSVSVARDPFALGVASYAEVSPARALTLTGSCGFFLRATRQTIKTEDYPLNSPMFFYLPARRLPKLARDFLAFARGPSAQIVIRRAGFVDQTPETIAIGEQGDRLTNAVLAAGSEIVLPDLKEMMDRLFGMERLTVSFRFEAGSSRLDAQSRSNISLLAKALEAGSYDARELLFVGFSDGEGAAVLNRGIAMDRAKAVRDAVVDHAETAIPGRTSFDVSAFGEAMPMACDDSAWGRQVNRRVEVWVR